MLHEKNLPKMFWAKVAYIVVFLQNRLSTKATRDHTPYEAWYGYKPPLNFLKIFGCLYFTYVSQSKRDKLDKRASPGIFIGYSTVNKGYKIFQPQTRSIVVSRDVYFIEDEEWNWDETKMKDPTMVDLQFKAPASRIGEEEDWQNELVDNAPVRGTRPLFDIYERCNIAVCEPADFRAAKEDQNWMKEELFIIEKTKHGN